MAPQVTVLNERQEIPKPSFHEFVVALFLTKSKPPEIAVRGYLAHIRSFIKSGFRPPNSTNGPRHIDSLAVWKDSHERLQQEIIEQRERIYSLERQLDASKGATTQQPLQQVGKDSVSDTVPNTRSKKRKRGGAIKAEDAEGHQTADSSAFLITGTVGSVSGLQDEAYTHLAGGKMPPVAEAGLLDASYALQKNLSQSPINASAAASIIEFVITLIRKSALPAGELACSSDSANGTGQRNMELLDGARARFIFSILLNAVDKLGQSSDGTDFQNQLIYAVVKLLKDLLDRICYLAAIRANTDEGQGKVPAKRRSLRRKQQPAPQRPEVHNKDIAGLCRLLVSALETLHQGRRTDQAIREGFMFSLLSKTGEILKSFVFGEDDETWNVVWTQQKSLRRLSSDEASRQEKRMAKERQAPYLVLLLERSLASFDDRRHLRSQVQNISQTTSVTPKNIRQGILTENLKVQLQETILKEVLVDNVQDFRTALEEPLDPEIEVEPWTHVNHGDVASFFKAEVWRLIGWDCLKSHVE